MKSNNTPLKGTPEEKSKQKMRSGFGDLTNGLSGFLKNLADLRPGLDRAGTIIRIRDNREMKGANAWLLMCSIMVASLGLDLDSPAVIIGAMLISPLMSPILGIGLSFGIEDRDMLRNSFYHLLVAIGIALVTSFIYFKLTPFGNMTPQIEARTAPTLLDVLVAFFGGIAGIVSGSRKDQSNAIPGVAIATALMPPLCVTGYGLANGDWDAMSKSFYLFFINATFVAIATYLIVRLLKFPQKTFTDKFEKQKTHQRMAIFSILLMIPSIWIMYTVYEKVQQKQKVQAYMNENFGENNWEWGQNNISTSEKSVMNVRAYLPESASVDSTMTKKISEFYLSCDSAAVLSLVQTNLPKEKLNMKNMKNSFETKVLSSLENDKLSIQQLEKELNKLKMVSDSLTEKTTFFNNITREAKVLFPQLEEIGYAKIEQTNFDTTLTAMPTFILKWNPKKKKSEKENDILRLHNWIKMRAKIDTLQIIAKQ